ncbi:MAG: HTTM domain-containing protein [Myxococcales bacterium]|nr:HTTM domain-containing protein [Myxococcales bacterium]
MELPHRALTAWNHLWFAPIDARWPAVMRITLGILLLWAWLQWGSDFEVLLHRQGPFDEQLLRTHWTDWRVPLFDGLTAGQLRQVHTLGILAIVAFTLGLATPVSNAAVALLLVGLWHGAPWVHNGGDRLLRIWTLTMLLTPSGARWSLDAWIAGRLGGQTRQTVPILAMRLVQLQLMIMYTATGISKLGGAMWWDGTAIYYAIADATFSRAPWLLDPVLRSPLGHPLSALLSWATVIWELAFVPGVLWRRTRAITLWVGVALHAGIFVTLAVGMFGPASVWGYQAFLVDREK